MKQSAKSKPKQPPNLPAASWEFTAIGTRWWIGMFEPVSPPLLRDLQAAIAKRIDTFDQTYSRFRADSLVTKVSEKAGAYEFPADAAQLFDFYKQLYAATDGAVTPLIGGVLAAAGYDANYSLKSRGLTPPPRWDEVLSVTGTTLVTKRPVLLDVGAAGKGYLVDLIADIIRAAGVRQFCVDASGDMLMRSSAPLRVGLEHPDTSSQIIGVAALKNRALCGSAVNRRAWGKYHHIMNPFTLRPVHDIKAVWVVADKALVADGVATALFFVAPNALSDFSFEYVIVNKDNRLDYSAGFPAELFS